MKNIQDGFYPVALTVNCSDSSGSGGIQTDLRTFNAAGVYGCSVVTAVKVREHESKSVVETIAADAVGKQLESVLGAMAVKAVKTGMTGDLEAMEKVWKCLQKKQLPVICDPVMFSADGTALMSEKCMLFWKEKLLSAAAFITLDLFEAEWLLNRKLRDQNAAVKAAGILADIYKCNVFLEAEYNSGNALTDGIAVLNGKSYLLTAPELAETDATAFYGVRDTFSSAVTAMLVCGNNWKDALRNARAYVYGSLCETALIGKDLEAMYPPLEDYSRAVKLIPLDKNSPKTAAKNRV